MTLALTRVDLSHFRSHRRAKLDLDARPVCIFGPNGAGKTNLIEAVSLLSPGRGLRRAASADFARKPEVLGWRVSAMIDAQGQPHEVEIRADAGLTRTTRIDGKPAPQIALARILRVLWLVPSMDRLWIEGAEGRRRFLDRMTLSFEPRHAEASVSYEKAMRERNRLLKDQITDPRWMDALERQMAEAGAAIIRNRRAALDRLSLAQTDAKTAFPSADLQLLDPSDHTLVAEAEPMARALADSRPADYRAGRSLVGPHRSDLSAIYVAKDVPASQCSTGEQKALLISLILANARALAVDLGAPPILLLDEVAAHLDNDRRTALYDEICGLGAQAWMTGTGPELFEALEQRAQKLEVTDVDGESRVEEAP